MESCMAKWADYSIVAVKRGRDGSSIAEVKVFPDNGETFGAAQFANRQEVINAIGRGTTFVTAYMKQDQKWYRGADVHVVEVEWQKYIRTDKNATKADNLGNLPEYV
jgi:hypothetical protein